MPARFLDDIPLHGEPELITPELTKPDDVVISGIAGRLPESDNIQEFRDHLMNGEDMVTDDDRRWTPGLHGLPSRSGKLKDISKFDAAFFGVHPKQSDGMDPQLRMLLEVTYEAIVDAGINPQALRGSRTGVFVGCSASESHEAWTTDLENIMGYEMTGCTRSMFANRLSFFFDFKGPSYALDTACSSSLLAMDQALQAIRSGQCDAAIVAGSSLCLKPSTTLQFQKLGMLSPDGACKSFDASGNGYCRSEAVVAIYIQKAQYSKRIYATLIHSKTNSDGRKQQGITFPSGEVQRQLLTEVYTECGVNPAEVAYVEAHGTGTKAGDPQELNSIVEVFCSKGREGPLLIGSTKSNMGHPEPASGLAALAKVLIAMEEGYIPANLHYKSPNPDIPALQDGRLQVISERTKWPGGYVGINSFGFGGSNVHVILRSNMSASEVVQNVEPRLITVSGRTKDGVEKALSMMREHKEQIQLQKLLQEQADLPPSAHPYRGYTIANHDNQAIETQNCSSESRPIWFVFAGMGTQWSGMGKDLMCIETFKDSILRSDHLLQPYGVQLYELLTNSSETTFNDTLNSFVCIAAIQVALVDILTKLGIKPDGVVGHSVGELGCAYADSGLTADETVLAAYWRGRCVQESNLPPGGMAAVGLTWAEAHRRCPPGVVPACHNAEDTVTISGPAAEITKFVEQLKQEGIFAKEVKSAGVAFHSYYMSKTAPALLAALQKVIVEKRPRSSQWISSSIPEANWGCDMAQTSSAEYHVNNLVSPVLFQEALGHVPRNAITIEIAPHCLLQSLLKRSLGPECVFVGLMKRLHPNNMDYLLSSLGKLYLAGLNFDPLSLCPAVHYPVARGTPMLSPFVQWDHSISWRVPKLEDFSAGGAGGTASCVYDVDVSPDSDDHYLVGHMIDGRVLFPATGYLVLTWRALARIRGQVYTDMAVTFEDVHIHRATIMPKSGSVRFEVSVTPGTGHFEVCESGTLVVSGTIDAPEGAILEVPMSDQAAVDSEPGSIPLTSADVYKELRLRGYDYGPTFQGIISTNNKGDVGHLAWNEDWVSFLDTMLQIQVLGLPGRGLRLPTRIKALRIDPAIHQQKLVQMHADSDKLTIQVQVDRVLDTCVAGGVEILGLHATVAPRRQHAQSSIIEKYTFVPYIQKKCGESESDLSCYAKICERYFCHKMKQLLHNGIAEQIPNQELFKNIIDSVSTSADVEDELESYCVKDHSQCSLLNVLHDVFSLQMDDGFITKARSLIRDAHNELQHDKLLSSMSRPHLLKPCLDMALENGSGTKVKVTEFCCQGQLPVYNHVLSQLHTQPMLNVEYVITGPGAADLDAEELDKQGITVIPWNGQSVPPGSLRADILVTHNIYQASLTEILSHRDSLICEGGFFLLQKPADDFSVPMLLAGLTNDLKSTDLHQLFLVRAECEKLLQKSELEIISQRSDAVANTSFLCRKLRPDLGTNEPVIIDVGDLSFSWVEEVKSAMLAQQGAAEGRIWLRAQSDTPSGVIGMVNCLRQEPGGSGIRCIYSTGRSHTLPACGSPEFRQLQARDLVMNIWRDGVYGSYRHVPHLTDSSSLMKNCEHAFVNVLTRGDLSSLTWLESPLKYFHETDEPSTKQLCRVHYTSLNFRDIMLATGKLPPDAIPGNLSEQDCLLGMEFSGRTQTGKRIMGLLSAKGLATTVDADERFLWSVPESWSLEQAASIPVVYATAYYALVVRGHIKRGDRVLIHAGSGGVGQAAISIALHRGCEVYTTCGTPEKRRFLKKRFPQLTDRNIANSRDRTFEWDVLRATGGHGVDVVLNSLAGDKLQASVRVLAQHGRFLEIGKVDLSNNSNLGMSIFLKNITFHGILLDALFDEGNNEWLEVFRLLSEGIDAGAVEPLSTTVFKRDEVESAFRYMAQGKHIGKVLIKVRSEETENLNETMRIPALGRTTCHPHKSYIITGGLGGFGLELAHWLIQRGARNLVLTSRSGIRTGYQHRCVRLWRESGTKVTISTRDVSELEEATHLLREAESLGPVGGIFHLAMVLRDGLMENQSRDNFQAVGGAKVTGTMNLDAVTRAQNRPQMDWFVVFSSVSCGRGNAGQANYGFANSVMERVCEARVQDGLPGLAVQWGAIGDVGVVLDTMGSNDIVIGGTLPQRITSCLHTLDSFLNQSEPTVSSFILAEKHKKSNTDSRAGLVDAVANILGVKDPSSLNQEATLGDLGLDSLMGVEVKQTLERDYDLTLPMQEIRGLTLGKLKDISSGTVKPPSESAKTEKAGVDVEKISQRFNPKQVMPSETLIQLSEGDGSHGILFIVHPIEGVLVSLQPVMEKVKQTVYGLQCTREAPKDSVEKLSAFYTEIIQEKQPKGPYHLAGYSFGACVAMEMSLQLQSQGHNVSKLVLLDGSHTYASAHIQKFKGKLAPGSQAAAETESMCAFLHQFITIDYSKLTTELSSLPDFTSRVQAAVRHLLATEQLSDEDDLTAAAKSFFHKLIMADTYRITGQLEGSTEVTLVKAADGHPQADTLGSDYGLSQVCSSSVVVHTVPGNHETFILGDSASTVADIVNDLL